MRNAPHQRSPVDKWLPGSTIKKNLDPFALNYWRIRVPSEGKPINLTLKIESADADAEELDRLARNLRTEIRELDIESVELVREETLPKGAKSAEAVTLGALAVAVLPGVVPKLVDLLQTWSMRGVNRAVKVKTQVGDRSLEVEYSPATMSQAELKSLVDMLTGALAPGDEG
jgi:hypothetical protein